MLRTARAFGVRKIWLTGVTPHPARPGDARLPHIARRVEDRLHKTALGAEAARGVAYHPNPLAVLERLGRRGYQIVAMETVPSARPLPDLALGQRLALVVGSETNGLPQPILDLADAVGVIPMSRPGASLNVAAAAAIGLYHCAFIAGA